MKKQILLCSVILALLFALSSCGAYGEEDGVVRAGVLVWKYSDTYGSAVRRAMKKYAAELGEEAGLEIKLEMQDGNDDQATQNNQADVISQDGFSVRIPYAKITLDSLNHLEQ